MEKVHEMSWVFCPVLTYENIVITELTEMKSNNKEFREVCTLNVSLLFNLEPVRKYVKNFTAAFHIKRYCIISRLFGIWQKLTF